MIAVGTISRRRWPCGICALLSISVSAACAPLPLEPVYDPRAEALGAPQARQRPPLQVRTVPPQEARRIPPATPAVRVRPPAVSMPAADVLYFRFDNIELTAAARRLLEPMASYLKASRLRARIEGHTDERGTREYNLALAQLRAESVARYLVLRGVPRARLEPVSMGEEAPAQIGSDERAWARNRRAHIIVMADGNER